MPSPRPVPRVSRYTFRYHFASSAFEGVLNGVFAINDVVARKSLGAGPLLLVLLTMAPSASQLFAVALAPRIVRSDLRRFFLIAGLLGRLVLLGVAWVTGPWAFLGVLVVNALVQTAVIPVQNAVYQSNYDPALRGRLFGWATALTGSLTVVAAMTAGRLLDRDPGAYRAIYPVAGLAGCVGLWVFGRIRRRRLPGSAIDPALVSAVDVARPLGRGAFTLARDVLGRDRAFLSFEAALMIYGLGFMSLQPCLAPFLVDVMGMDYGQAALAKGAIFYVAMVLATPLAGLLHDRLGLERLATLACAGLACFAATLSMAGSIAVVYVAFAIFGAAMASIHVIWTMGPIKYAGSRDAASYMAVHVTLVGVRGLLGHPLGGTVAVLAGTPRATFLLAALLFATAAFGMGRLDRATRAAAPGPNEAGILHGP